MHKLFVYGTLQIPDVMLAVIGRRFDGISATLEGFSCHRLRGHDFPGLRPNAGAQTPGLLYRDIDAQCLKRLDEFEDDFYQRVTLPVTDGLGQQHDAQVYVVVEEARNQLIEEAWQLEQFTTTTLDRFLREHCR